MGLSYRKSKNLGAGLRLNSSRSGVGMSWGVKGFRVGIGPKGTRTTFSIPGTGIRYQTESRNRRAIRSKLYQQGYRIEEQDAQNQPPKKKRKIWLWVLIGLFAIGGLANAINGNMDAQNQDHESKFPEPSLQAFDVHSGLSSTGTYVAATSTVYYTPVPTTAKPIATATATPITPTASTIPMLKQGMNGELVKAMQERLILLGFLPDGKADGEYGRDTKQAVADFQKRNGLDSDGVAGEKTLALLYSNNAKQINDPYVWIVKEGKKYHSRSDCSNMKSPYQVKKSEAEKMGRGPCKRCH